MKSSDLADSTARALDLLPPGDPAAADPRMSRDPRLIKEARSTREAAADVWLAVSPLHVAPPDILQAVLAKINSPTPSKLGTPQRYLPWLAATGWAAAAAVAFLLWPKSREIIPPRLIKVETTTTAVVPNSRAENPISAAPTRNPKPSDDRLQKEILRLRARLADVREERWARSPRVISLSAPGAPRRTSEEARVRVQTILKNALLSALEIESGASSDPAALVIERGWLSGGLPAPEEGGVIRHRNFPENNWQEMGLQRSEEGEYFDETANIIWSADPEGRGFIGRKSNPQDNVSRFTKDPKPTVTETKAPRTAPEGFIIEDPDTKTAEIYIDKLPPPAEGMEHIFKITDDKGNTTRIPIPQPTSTPNPKLAVIPEAGAETIVATSDGETSSFLLAPSSTLVSPNSFFTPNGTLGNFPNPNNSFSNIVGYIIQNDGSIVTLQVVEGSIGIIDGPEKIIIGSGN
jgi:hypothetical protein